MSTISSDTGCSLFLNSMTASLHHSVGAPAHSAPETQEWIAWNSPEFISKAEWPPNSPDLNPLDYDVWGAKLHKYQQYQPKSTNKVELKLVLDTIWKQLPQSFISKAVIAFRRDYRAASELMADILTTSSASNCHL